MSDSSTVVELRPLPVTAEGWCARLYGDDVTEGDRLGFEAWVAASAENRAEYELCAMAFGVARGLAGAPGLRADFSLNGSAEKKKHTFFQRRALSAVAAGAAMVLVAGAWLWQMPRNSYATDVGEQRQISLADGSTVQLNTASALGVDLETSERRVVLRHGEAFFSVAKDSSRPFTVRAGASPIVVLGTGSICFRVSECGPGPRRRSRS
jgi:transmembrane sensor